ncbi:MAG: sodium-dependent transporter [Planctomycetota bacterium]|nr:sodium-dependent transporter [Planctomycetota bacterium]
MSAATKQEWGTRLGVILAVAGSAVGLGNFLRFPGQAAQHGGGAFMIPYFCALLLLGIPIGWAEWTMGRYGGRKGFHSAPAIMGVIGGGKLWRYLGVIGVLIPLGVSFYYVFIEAWCLQYFFKYVGAIFGGAGIGLQAGGDVAAQTQASSAHFSEMIGKSADGALFDGGIAPIVWFWIAVFAINVWLVRRGLSGGIETFCKWAMPSMAVCALVVLVRVLTLPAPTPEQTVGNGLGFMWNPDFEALKHSETWLAAAGQIFFSLSVGFGVIINYASYLKRKDDLVLSGLTASATNELFEVGFGGMITLTASFVFLGATGAMAAAASGTFGLGFTTLPVVFAQMPAGNFIGALWFFMLFLAAITSSISMYQPTLAFVQEALGCARDKAIAIVAFVGFIGSAFVVYHSGGMVALGTIDDWVGTFLIVVLAAVQVICFAWIFGMKRGMKEAHEGAAMRIPSIFYPVIKYVAPAYLIIAIAVFASNDLPKWFKGLGENTVARNSILLIVAVTVFLCVLVAIGEKRWRAAGLDVDGERPPDDEIAAMQHKGGKR